MSKLISIYYLCSSKDNVPRYIGKTSLKPRKRLAGHKSDAKNGKGSYSSLSWIKKHLDVGYKIEMHVIDEIPFDEFSFQEGYWVEQFKAWGFDILNHRTGYEESSWIPGTKRNFSEESLNNIKKAASARKGEGRNEFPQAREHIKKARESIKNNLKIKEKAKATRRETIEENMKLYGAYFPVRKLKVEFVDGSSKIYESIREASRDLDIQYNTLYSAIKRNSNFRKQYVFSFVN